jgi:hypothetical protein
MPATLLAYLRRLLLLFTLSLLDFYYALHVTYVATLKTLLIPTVVVSVEQDITFTFRATLKP